MLQDWRLAAVLMRPDCQYIITVWAGLHHPLPHSSTAHMRHFKPTLAISTQRHRRQTVHLYIGHREKLHTGTRTLAIVIDINTHQRSWWRAVREGRGTWDTTTPSSVAKQSVDPSSSCPGPLLWTGGRKCSADQQQECLLSRVYRQCSGW